MDTRLNIDEKEEQFLNIFKFIQDINVEIKRVYICQSNSERMLDEELFWLLQVFELLLGTNDNYRYVFTKLDTQKSEERLRRSLMYNETCNITAKNFNVLYTGEDGVEMIIEDLIDVELVKSSVVMKNYHYTYFEMLKKI